MRMPVNRLLYVLVGAALAVGLLVNVFERPQPALTASVDCYGLCPSSTELTLSTSTVTYGAEQVVKFSARVIGATPGTGVPTGSVAVRSGSRTLCFIALVRGTGSCSPSATALSPGSYTVAAFYDGDRSFSPSRSISYWLHVVVHQTTTALSLSTSTVTYGRMQVLRFTVRVSTVPPGAGVPTGTAVVKSGSRLLCYIHLVNGIGSCSPAATALSPGSYTVAAFYDGNASFNPSRSISYWLHVQR